MATKDTNYLVAVHKGLDESLEKQVAGSAGEIQQAEIFTKLHDGSAGRTG